MNALLVKHEHFTTNGSVDSGNSTTLETYPEESLTLRIGAKYFESALELSNKILTSFLEAISEIIFE